MRELISEVNVKVKALYRNNEDLFRFILAVISVHFIWKIAFLNPLGDTTPNTLFFGTDISDFLLPVSSFLAESTFQIVKLLSNTPTNLDSCSIQFENAAGLLVVWGCSGIKQMLIFSTIILLARGDKLHKIWFIPAGIILLHVVNIIRLVILSFVSRDYPEGFEFIHGVVLKIGYYVIIFGIWLLWINYFSTQKKSL